MFVEMCPRMVYAQVGGAYLVSQPSNVRSDFPDFLYRKRVWESFL